jgi:hypothetical protein
MGKQHPASIAEIRDGKKGVSASNLAAGMGSRNEEQGRSE